VSHEAYHYTDNASYVQRQSQFEMLPVADVDVVFAGDSITARFEWQEYFPDLIVANRGIDSDVSEGLKNRLDCIIAEKPEKIFLMIGINDIRQSIPAEDTLANYREIVSRLKQELPECTIYIQSILPVSHTTGIDNADVRALNEQLKALASEEGLTYIDLYTSLVSSDDDFLYTADGVHPTGEGYQIWMDLIDIYLH
jgi:lysophospholipase L1-like esterase